MLLKPWLIHKYIVLTLNSEKLNFNCNQKEFESVTMRTYSKTSKSRTLQKSISKLNYGKKQQSKQRREIKKAKAVSIFSTIFFHTPTCLYFRPFL